MQSLYCDTRLFGVERWSIGKPKDWLMRIPDPMTRSASMTEDLPGLFLPTRRFVPKEKLIVWLAKHRKFLMVIDRSTVDPSVAPFERH
jgi:hypothetical protein